MAQKKIGRKTFMAKRNDEKNQFSPNLKWTANAVHKKQLT
jgi:hypothetical protein